MSSVLDHYLTLFDEDFTKVNKNGPPDPNAFLKLTAPNLPPAPKARARKRVKTAATVGGWQDETLIRAAKAASYEGKDVKDWNSIDLRRYVANTYFKKWGETLKGNIQVRYNNQVIASVENIIRTRLGLEGYAVLKEYFDWFIDTQVVTAAQMPGGMMWNRFSYFKFVNAFCDKRKQPQAAAETLREPEAAVETPSAPKSHRINLGELQTAFRMNPQVFVSRYGVVIPINYLLMVRKQSVDKAVEYVRNAVNKIHTVSPAAVREVFEATERYEPYPKWFAYGEPDALLTELSTKCGQPKPSAAFGDADGDFGFMRDIV
jgi:hypothetical protein